VSLAVKKSGFPRLFARLLCWSVWLALFAALALQLRILADGGVRLPSFAQDYIARHAAAKGLSLEAEAVWLDPRGRVLVLRPRIGLVGQGAPFASARAVALQLRRSALLTGKLRASRIELTDLSLSLPPLLSPTGASQPLLTAGEFRLSHASETELWRVDQASARLLDIPAAFTGTLPAVPDDSAPRRAPAALAHSTLRQAATLYRQLAALPLDSLRVLRLHLDPDRLVVSAELERLVSPAHPAIPPALVGSTLEEVELRLALPFSAPLRARPADAELHLLAARFTSPPSLALRGEGLALRASPGPIFAADLALARIEKTDTPVPPLPLVAAARYAPAGRALDFELSARLTDAPWRARFSGSLTDLAGAVSAYGELTPALLASLRPFLPEKVRPILELTDPIDLDLSAELAPGARPGRVIARASSGRAVAGHVPFDRAGASLVYEPAARLLRADDLLLIQGDSQATGSYEMDTETLAFRFLLDGRLRPMAIEGWFSRWWDNLWGNFTFGAIPPAASVDIRGVWLVPDLTTVFVQASSGPLRLRALELDTLHTRVRTAASSFDILGFQATREAHRADGRFARLLGPDHSTWARMSFDIRSDFPVEALPRLFPAEGPALVASFSLDAPPRIHLFGETHGPASATPGSQRYDLHLSTDAPLRYSGFPLDHLALRLERRDTDLNLRDIRAGFASGLATGEAHLSGPDKDRWLAFDLTLADAEIDLVQTRWKEFQATRPAQPPAPGTAVLPPASAIPPAVGETADAQPQKPLGGHITFHLAATGPLADPLSYSGQGEGRLTGADLARIRLMGPFSTLLGELGLGFTTLKLTEADIHLGLDRNRLVFDKLRLTGPSALVEAKGVYAIPGGDLNFTAKVRPFDQREGVFSNTANLVTSPLSNALEVKLTGTLDTPAWSFTYGPTRLIRRLF
jgi:hypothetical protein